ncbi:hypothetical protein SHJG_0360 [Streptomyces hygroscopicus subsp. jinggangensis 5008]|nr:hypothetical protein SHJG_0360 [Streptomyces hygroscopicus subsp. jinggangensis 5008]AGF59860.1 hypothetical protein SHJGH_0194 [Streptomyces hygroscopicus subsp. jinggangensis TL01]
MRHREPSQVVGGRPAGHKASDAGPFTHRWLTPRGPRSP